MADERTIAEIEHDLAQARQRLADNLSQLITQVHPKAVARRTVAEGKRQLRWTFDQVRHWLKDESGWKPVAVIGSVVVVAGVIALVVKKK